MRFIEKVWFWVSWSLTGVGALGLLVTIVEGPSLWP